MSQAEREAFLADVHVGVIGIATAAGPALAVPIWYGYEPGGELWVITEPSSVKARAIASAGRFSLCAQTEAPPYKYVSVEGPVTSTEVCDEPTRRAMAYRYLGPEFGDMYLESTADRGGSHVYRMSPERWYTVDFAKDFTG
ncbi:MAG: pyridoxamine 5'-phosphate oxidase [Actinobacteria bacterium]|nr:MAG: pyridoxamine 5'-phosphate oxidase [Actinomycetota bacterium]RIK04036.1 MAG: pyridoxamine 5'-phosphate oxidase [Acidobacteriota bacterium]